MTKSQNDEKFNELLRAKIKEHLRKEFNGFVGGVEGVLWFAVAASMAYVARGNRAAFIMFEVVWVLSILVWVARNAVGEAILAISRENFDSIVKTCDGVMHRLETMRAINLRLVKLSTALVARLHAVDPKFPADVDEFLRSNLDS